MTSSWARPSKSPMGCMVANTDPGFMEANKAAILESMVTSDLHFDLLPKTSLKLFTKTLSDDANQ